jgi:hypothetical protein
MPVEIEIQFDDGKLVKETWDARSLGAVQVPGQPR